MIIKLNAEETVKEIISFMVRKVQSCNDIIMSNKRQFPVVINDTRG